MDQPVHGLAGPVEALRERVKKGCLAIFIVSARRMGDHVRELDHARRPRVDEKRRLAQVVKLAPPVPFALGAESTSKILKRRLVRRLVENNQSPLGVPDIVQSAEIPVETIAYVLKSQLHRIFRSARRLVNGASEDRYVTGRSQDGHSVQIGSRARLTRDASPMLFARQNIRPAKLQRVRAVRPHARCKFIEIFGKPVRLPFEDRKSRKNKMLILGILDRPGIVQIKQIHSRS